MNFIADKSSKAVEAPSVALGIDAHHHLCGNDLYLQKNYKDSQLLMKVEMLDDDNDVVAVSHDSSDSKAFYKEEKDQSNGTMHHVTPGDDATVTASATFMNNSNRSSSSSSSSNSSVVIDLIDENSTIIKANAYSNSGNNDIRNDNDNNKNNNNNTSTSQSLGIFSHRLFKLDQMNSLQFLKSSAADVSVLPTTDNLKYLKVTSDGNDKDDDDDDDVSLQSLDDDDDVDVVDSNSEDGMKDKEDLSSYEE